MCSMALALVGSLVSSAAGAGDPLNLRPMYHFTYVIYSNPYFFDVSKPHPYTPTRRARFIWHYARALVWRTG